MNLRMSTMHSDEGILTIKPTGRLDAYGSKNLQQEIDSAITPQTVCAVIDMAFVEYLSSAGLRVFVSLAKKIQGANGLFGICNVPTYSRQVLNISGFGESFPEFSSLGEAHRRCEVFVRDSQMLSAWDQLETASLPIGEFRFIPGHESPGAIEVLGSIEDVLHSRVTVNHLCSKKFSDTEYSLGLGGLGDRVEDYFSIMGEMMTVGGTMVWLPTDGHDTADFLIPRKDHGEVTLRTGFNASISGEFNEMIYFKSADPNGTTITDLYRAIFDQAKDRRTDYLGALGLAMRAEMGNVFGCGIRKSPVTQHAPANGEMVTHPSNFGTWFETDAQPRYQNVTGLLCGCGIDLTTDLAAFDHAQMGLAFYVNPANPGAANQQLHNHAVFFSPLPMPDKAVSVEREIERVVNTGDFMDMRHLLDASTVKSAIIGVSYTQTFRQDPQGQSGVH